MSIDEKILDEWLNKELPKKEEEKMKITLLDQKDRSLRFGCVGVGQAGSRLIETFYKYGYSSVAINTAKQDLDYIKLAPRKKMLLDMGLSGAGKDLARGEEAIVLHKDNIAQFLGAELIADSDFLFLVISGGGGSGSGSVMPMLELMGNFGLPLGVIYVLPLNTDDAQAKKNSLTTLAKLAKLSTTNVISTLIVVDNSKIETMFGGLSMADFWQKANEAIVNPIHLFNTLTNQASAFTSLDASDFGKILTYGDISLMGMIEVEDYMNETALAEAAVNSLESGLLASHFDLKQCKIGGIIIVGSKEVLEQLPTNNVNYLFHIINEQTDNAALYKGVYAIDTDKTSVQVYCWFAGLGLPLDRINALKQESAVQDAKAEEKVKSRATTMAFDVGEKTTSAAQEIHKKIQNKNSAFSKLGSNKGIIDKRKK